MVPSIGITWWFGALLPGCLGVELLEVGVGGGGLPGGGRVGGALLPQAVPPRPLVGRVAGGGEGRLAGHLVVGVVGGAPLMGRQGRRGGADGDRC